MRMAHCTFSTMIASGRYGDTDNLHLWAGGEGEGLPYALSHL